MAFAILSYAMVGAWQKSLIWIWMVWDGREYQVFIRYGSTGKNSVDRQEKVVYDTFRTFVRDKVRYQNTGMSRKEKIMAKEIKMDENKKKALEAAMAQIERSNMVKVLL